jgi:hypothetical protein
MDLASNATEATATRHDRNTPATHNSRYSSRGLSEKPLRSSIATVWTNKQAASYRASV